MNQDEQLIKSFENDPVVFIEVFLERELSTKQRNFIEYTKKKNHVIAIWSRQTGKSTVIASYIVWRLLYGKGCVVKGEHLDERIAIVAPIKEQINNLYDKIRTLVDRNDVIASYFIKLNSERIIAKNGNRANFMSGSPGSHIRGYTATCIVIDESQDIGDHKYSADILPFGATTNALIIEAGTPKTKNHFYNSINAKHIKVVKQLWFECPFLSKEYVMAQKESSPEALWRQEYLCEFIEEGVLAFPGHLFEPSKDGKHNLADYKVLRRVEQLTKEIVEAIKEEKDATYTAGLDLGRQEDNTVLAIWRTDLRPIRQVAEIVFPLGTQYTELARMVGMFYRVFQWYEFNLDYTNEKSFIEMLQENNVPVIIDKKMTRGAIHYTPKNKTEMVNNTRMLLENYQLQLSNDSEDLLHEFLNQHFEINENTKQWKFYHPTNEHDDRLWATLMALKNVRMHTIEDTTDWHNPWEKQDEFVHGSKNRDTKEKLLRNKEMKFRKRYKNAEVKRLKSRGYF